MKSNVFALSIALFGCLFITACDDGTWEYGYAYNPKGVVQRVFESLEQDDYDTDWSTLFSGSVYTQYSSEEGIQSLKNKIGDLKTAKKRFEVKQPVLFAQKPGLKKYQVQVVRKSNQRLAFDIEMNCYQWTERGTERKRCAIVKLESL